MPKKIIKPPKEKKSKFIEELEEKEKDLLARQERFCQLYSSDREFFGNGVESYLECYDIDRSKPNWYKTACAAASRLLSNVKVYTRINELLESEGLNDSFVDKQLLFLISQQDDKTNKVAAIREYNKLKQRITDKIDLKSDGKQIVGFTFVVPEVAK
ncbi:MAG: hypothetical protein WA019_04070 [Candidatus Moraniibacteriota bacterium]